MDEKLNQQPAGAPASLSNWREEERAKLEKALPEVTAAKRVSWRDSLKLPARFAPARFDSCRGEVQPAALGRAKEFAAICQTEPLPTTPLALVLCSEGPGVGKTHLLSALANELVDTMPTSQIGNFDEQAMQPCLYHNPCPVCYMTEPDLLCLLRGAFDRESEEREQQLYARLNRYRLLIIDDVGKVKARDPAYTQQVLYRLIDYRWSDLRFFALASNLVGSQLESYLSGPVASRLAQMTQGSFFLTLTGKDLRLEGLGKGAVSSGSGSKRQG